MHQIISGETPKVIVKNINFNEFIIDNKKIFNDLKNVNIFYNNLVSIDRIDENYFQFNDIKKEFQHIKAILKKEYFDCEKLYPNLGEVFLEYFFNKKATTGKYEILFDKNKITKLFKVEKNKIITSIFKNYIENCSLEYVISIEQNFLNKIHIEKSNSIMIKKSFDKDFYSSHKKNEFSNYKVCIIDGYVDSVGEIHHLLQKSSDNKEETYIIFCYGMSGDVKKTIIVNNQRRNTRIFPISLSLTEENLNIFNDISVIHNCDIISANKGQTISQSLRKKLPIGRKIIINPSLDTIIIEPVCNDLKIKKHLDFLNKKIKTHNMNDQNKDLIIGRIKSLNSKNYKIFLPNEYLKNRKFITKINYYCNLMSKLNLKFKKIKISSNEHVWIPSIYYSFAKEKANSIKKILNKIDVLIEDISHARN